jgi:hypothetical protein
MHTLGTFETFGGAVSPFCHYYHTLTVGGLCGFELGTKFSTEAAALAWVRRLQHDWHAITAEVRVLAVITVIEAAYPFCHVLMHSWLPL